MNNQDIRKIYENTPDEVISVSFGRKKINNKITNELCIIFVVKKKLSLQALENQYVIPKTIEINGKIYPTDVIEEEKFQMLSCPVWPSDLIVPNRSKQRPLKGGVSISAWPFKSVGTLGLICLDSKTQSLVGLTNAHILFKDPLIYDNPVDFTVIENSAYPKKEVVQFTEPTINYPNDVIGEVLRYTPFRKNISSVVDAALISIYPTGIDQLATISPSVSFQQQGLELINTPLDFATTNEINSLLINNVELYSAGRSTGPKGFGACRLVVDQMFVNTLSIYYPFSDQSVNFSDVIIFRRLDNAANPVLNGDSGSIIIGKINNTYKIVGLVFAASTNFGVFCRIDLIRTILEIEPWNGTLNNYFPQENSYQLSTFQTVKNNTSNIVSSEWILNDGEYWLNGFVDKNVADILIPNNETQFDVCTSSSSSLCKFIGPNYWGGWKLAIKIKSPGPLENFGKAICLNTNKPFIGSSIERLFSITVISDLKIYFYDIAINDNGYSPELRTSINVTTNSNEKDYFISKDGTHVLELDIEDSDASYKKCKINLYKLSGNQFIKYNLFNNASIYLENIALSADGLVFSVTRSGIDLNLSSGENIIKQNILEIYKWSGSNYAKVFTKNNTNNTTIVCISKLDNTIIGAPPSRKAFGWYEGTPTFFNIINDNLEIIKTIFEPDLVPSPYYTYNYDDLLSIIRIIDNNNQRLFYINPDFPDAYIVPLYCFNKSPNDNLGFDRIDRPTNNTPVVLTQHQIDSDSKGVMAYINNDDTYTNGTVESWDDVDKVLALNRKRNKMISVLVGEPTKPFLPNVLNFKDGGPTSPSNFNEAPNKPLVNIESVSLKSTFMGRDQYPNDYWLAAGGQELGDKEENVDCNQVNIYFYDYLLNPPDLNCICQKDVYYINDNISVQGTPQNPVGYGNTTVPACELFELPMIVKIAGKADDLLLINNQVLSPVDGNSETNANWEFILTNNNFVVSAGNIGNDNKVEYDLRICFEPTGSIGVNFLGYGQNNCIYPNPNIITQYAHLYRQSCNGGQAEVQGISLIGTGLFFNNIETGVRLFNTLVKINKPDTPNCGWPIKNFDLGEGGKSAPDISIAPGRNIENIQNWKAPIGGQNGTNSLPGCYENINLPTAVNADGAYTLNINSILQGSYSQNDIKYSLYTNLECTSYQPGSVRTFNVPIGIKGTFFYVIAGGENGFSINGEEKSSCGSPFITQGKVEDVSTVTLSSGPSCINLLAWGWNVPRNCPEPIEITSFSIGQNFAVNNPNDPVDRPEFLVFKSKSECPINLSGWRIESASPSVVNNDCNTAVLPCVQVPSQVFTFPAGIILPKSGDTVRIDSGPGAVQNLETRRLIWTNYAPPPGNPAGLVWNDCGDIVKIYNATGKLKVLRAVGVCGSTNFQSPD